jgi:hypothetical protein
MTKIYCGVGKIPKNSRKGSMRECAEMGQIRLYGLYKVDPKIIAVKSKPSTKEKQMGKEDIRKLLFKYKGRIQKLERELNFEDNKDKKKTKKELEAALKEKDHYLMIYKKLETGQKIAIKPEAKKGTKKGTKKDTPVKKGTKKDTPAKKGTVKCRT